MFSEAERRIYNLETNDKLSNSRLSSCENEIYRINNKLCGESLDSISDKIATVEYSIEMLTNQVDKLTQQFETLAVQMNEVLSYIGPDLDANSVKPKLKADLEILEENSEFKVDPYITPEYYLDDKKKNDYWYWNGE